MKTRNRLTPAPAPAPSFLEALLTNDDTAKLLSIQPNTLNIWRTQGRGPKFVRVSAAAIRYRPEDVREFIDANIVGV